MKSFDESWKLSMDNAQKWREYMSLNSETEMPTNKYDITAIVVNNETDQRFVLKKSYDVVDSAEALGQYYVDMYKTGLEEICYTQEISISLDVVA